MGRTKKKQTLAGTCPEVPRCVPNLLAPAPANGPIVVPGPRLGDATLSLASASTVPLWDYSRVRTRPRRQPTGPIPRALPKRTEPVTDPGAARIERVVVLWVSAMHVHERDRDLIPGRAEHVHAWGAAAVSMTDLHAAGIPVRMHGQPRMAPPHDLSPEHSTQHGTQHGPGHTQGQAPTGSVKWETHGEVPTLARQACHENRNQDGGCSIQDALYLQALEYALARWGNTTDGTVLIIPRYSVLLAFTEVEKAWPHIYAHQHTPFREPLLSTSPARIAARRAAAAHWGLTDQAPVGDSDLTITAPNQDPAAEDADSDNPGDSAREGAERRPQPGHTGWQPPATTLTGKARRKALLVATDGSTGGDGRSTFAWVTHQGQWHTDLRKAYPINRAETMAAAAALTMLSRHKPMVLISDSVAALSVITQVRDQVYAAAAACAVPDHEEPVSIGTLAHMVTQDSPVLASIPSSILRRVARAILTRTAPLELRWVQGHHGHGLNELADRLALQTRRLHAATVPARTREERLAQIAAEVHDLHTPPTYTDMVEGTVLFENGSSVRQHMARSSTTS